MFRSCYIYVPGNLKKIVGCSCPLHNGATAGISATRVVSQLFASLSNVRYVKIVNIITAVFLYDLFCHYSYDNLGVMRLHLGVATTEPQL